MSRLLKAPLYFLLSVGAYVLLVFLINLTTVAQPNNDLVVIAHRGASSVAPENTLAAAEQGITYGADMIELDIHLTKDGKIVVIHDHTVDRTTNGTGTIADMTLEEVQKLDAGSWKDPKYADQRVPTLDEFLKLVNGRATVLIEIKSNDKKLYEGIEQKTWDIVEANNAHNWVAYQSFHPKVIDNFLAIDPKCPIYLLIVGRMPLFPLYYDDAVRWGSPFKRWKGKVLGINPNTKFASKSFINKAHKNGFKVFSWTANEGKDIEKLKNNGADGVITNYPQKLTGIE